MKRYLFFFFIFFTSVSLFFSFTLYVDAYTYNFTITQDMINFVSDSRFVSSVSNNAGSWYPVVNYKYDTSSGAGSYYYTDFKPANNYSFNCYRSTSVTSVIDCSSTPTKNRFPIIINSDYTFTTLSSSSQFNFKLNSSINNNYYSIVYSPYYTFNYIYNNRDDIINITDGLNTFTCSVDSINTSCSLPSVYSWYLDYYSTPPAPPDNTPVLTSFIDLVIDRLSYICDFFTSSYIYLSVFVILILYISILLLRRLL